MAQLLVRRLDDDLKDRLQQRARRHGRSTEEEVREILRTVVLREEDPDVPLGSRLALRFAPFPLDQELPELRGQAPRPAEFES